MTTPDWSAKAQDAINELAGSNKDALNRLGNTCAIVKIPDAKAILTKAFAEAYEQGKADAMSKENQELLTSLDFDLIDVLIDQVENRGEFKNHERLKTILKLAKAGVNSKFSSSAREPFPSREEFHNHVDEQNAKGGFTLDGLYDYLSKFAAPKVVVSDEEIEKLVNKTEIISMGPATRGFEINLKPATEVVQVLGAQLTNCLKEQGADNYVEIMLQDPNTGEGFTVLIQRNKGLTPAQKLGEERALCDKLAIAAKEMCEAHEPSHNNKWQGDDGYGVSRRKDWEQDKRVLKTLQAVILEHKKARGLK